MGKQTGSATTTSKQSTDMGPWSAQQPYLTKLFSEAQNLYNKGPAQYYPTSTVSPLTDAQNQGINQTIGMGSTVNPLLGAQNQTAQDTISGKYLDPSTNPYLAKTYGQAADQVTRSYQTATAPGTAAAFSAAGRYGSGAQNQQIDQNNRALGTSLDNLATNIYGGNYQQERQNQLNATNNTGQYVSNNYIPSAETTQAGALQQQQSQQQLTDQVNRFNFNQQSPWQNLQQYQGAISGNYGQQGTTTGTQTQPITGSPVGTGIGALLGLGSLAANFAMPGVSGVSAGANLLGKSDRRLKENIRLIGKSFDGQNIYVYNFIGERLTQIGLMAQEVQEIKPETVHKGADGFLRIDYAKALADAR